MNFKDLGRAKLTNILGIQLRSNRQESKFDPYQHYIDILNTELVSEDLLPLVNFVYEYHRTYDCLYGYLFEPYGLSSEIRPLSQKSRRAGSPYFCVKLPISDMGSVFLIPLNPNDSNKFALVLKPLRLYRKSIISINYSIEPAPVEILYPPYRNLTSNLEYWAVRREAELRNVR